VLQSMRSAAKYIWWAIAILFLIGFVFYQQSGLTSQKVTPGTAIATVNGTDINFIDFERVSQGRIRQQQEGSVESR
jgi:hypothetical protein